MIVSNKDVSSLHPWYWSNVDVIFMSKTSNRIAEVKGTIDGDLRGQSFSETSGIRDC